MTPDTVITETLKKIATAPAGEPVTCPWDKGYTWTVDGRVGAFAALSTGKLSVRGTPGNYSLYLGGGNAFRAFFKVRSALITLAIAYTVLFINYRFLSGFETNTVGYVHLFLMDTVLSSEKVNNLIGFASTVFLALWLGPRAYFFSSLGIGGEMVMPSGKLNGLGLISITGFAGALGFAIGYGMRIFGA